MNPLHWAAPGKRLHSLVNALAEAKIDRVAAERIATEIFGAIHDNVATKSDIRELGSGLRELELRLKAEIDRVVIRLGALVLALTGLVLAAMRYLPPAH